jgi:DNA-binding transcriptional regulator YiaG
LDRKDVNLLRVADKYVADLRATPKPDLWRDYYKLESKILGSEGGEALMEGVSVFVTVQLPDEAVSEARLNLAKAKQVSVSVLAGQIITDYVKEERWVMVYLHEITPDLVRELSDQLEADEIRSLVAAEVRDLSDRYKAAMIETAELLARCQVRAIKLENLGVSRSEVARMFDVSVRTVAKWVRSDLQIPVKGWSNG